MAETTRGASKRAHDRPDGQAGMDAGMDAAQASPASAHAAPHGLYAPEVPLLAPPPPAPPSAREKEAAQDAAEAAAKAAKGKARAEAKAARAALKQQELARTKLRAKIKMTAVVVVCLLSPGVVGIILHAGLHMPKGQSTLIALGLYPVFIAVFVYFLVRALFKPGADKDAASAPLPPDTMDPAGRDDPSLLV